MLFLQQERAAGIGAVKPLPLQWYLPSLPAPCLQAPPVRVHCPYQHCWNKVFASTDSGVSFKCWNRKGKKKSPPTLTYLITCQGLLGCLLGSGLPSLGKRDNIFLLKHNLVRLPLNGILKMPKCGRPAQAVLYLGWMQLPFPWFLSSEVHPFP